ncbi:Hypothetical predicted protein [Paramuricea clavata]|uniref:Uncharacterized protein n=1 Tax=Paramuricea clavata TaxID=317549 RepID=A0A6S7GTH4_PARCT|nr:Hypothetical predicted protein [Paramuricea clavata]
MERLNEEGYKTLFSSDYTNIIIEIREYLRLESHTITGEDYNKLMEHNHKLEDDYLELDDHRCGLDDDRARLEDDNHKLKSENLRLKIAFNKLVKRFKTPIPITRRTKY